MSIQRPILIFSFFFFCAALVFPCTPRAADFSGLKKTGTAKVVSVITAQTLSLDNGGVLHLSGLHFPDYTPQNAGPFAITAMKIMQDMLTGERIQIYQTKKSDWGRSNRMGHQLAHIQIENGELWVQGALLSLGLAAVETSARNPEMADQMLAIERAARAEKIGIWENNFVLSPETSTEHIGAFQIVEGVIKSTAINNNRIYLNFGGNWRTDFTVSIAPEDKRNFSGSGANPLDWTVKHVRVRGWVREYNGPFMEITHPQAIEFLQ